MSVLDKLDNWLDKPLDRKLVQRVAPAVVAVAFLIALLAEGFPVAMTFKLVLGGLALVWAVQLTTSSVHAGHTWKQWIIRATIPWTFGVVLITGVFNLWVLGMTLVLLSQLVFWYVVLDTQPSFLLGRFLEVAIKRGNGADNGLSTDSSVGTPTEPSEAADDGPTFPSYGSADQSVIPENSPYFKEWERGRKASDEGTDEQNEGAERPPNVL